MVVEGRAGGYSKVWVLSMVGADVAAASAVPFPDAASNCGLGDNAEYDAATLRVRSGRKDGFSPLQRRWVHH